MQRISIARDLLSRSLSVRLIPTQRITVPRLDKDIRTYAATGGHDGRQGIALGLPRIGGRDQDQEIAPTQIVASRQKISYPTANLLVFSYVNTRYAGFGNPEGADGPGAPWPLSKGKVAYVDERYRSRFSILSHRKSLSLPPPTRQVPAVGVRAVRPCSEFRHALPTLTTCQMRA